MNYYGSDIEIKVNSKCDYADDMQVLNDFRELSKKICEKYDVKIKIKHELYARSSPEEEIRDCCVFEIYEGKNE